MHNPPQLGDFLGDEHSYERCLGAYEQGWLAFGNGCTPDENPFDKRSDESWFWNEGFYNNLEDVW